MRLFIALNLPDAVKQQIESLRNGLASVLAAQKADVKWVRTDQLHITLKFLGECEPGQADALTHTLQEAVGGFGTFPLSLGGLGCFPDHGPVKVVWLGLQEGTAQVSELAQRLGLQADQTFRPHLTLGRVKGLRRGGKIRAAVRAYPSEAIGPFTMTSVELMQSKLSASGPAYTVLYSAGLAKT